MIKLHVALAFFLASAALLLMGCGGTGAAATGGSTAGGGSTGSSGSSAGGGSTGSGVPQWAGPGANAQATSHGLGTGALGTIAWQIASTDSPIGITGNGLLIAGTGGATPTVTARKVSDGTTVWTTSTLAAQGWLDSTSTIQLGSQSLDPGTGAVTLQNGTTPGPTPVGIDSSGRILAVGSAASYYLSPTDLSQTTAPNRFLSVAQDLSGGTVGQIDISSRQVVGQVKNLGWSVVLNALGGKTTGPVIGSDGTVYAVFYDSLRVTAAAMYPASGVLKWQRTLYTASGSPATVSRLAIAADGSLIVAISSPGVGSDNGVVCSLSSSDGTVNWTDDLGDPDLVPPVTAADGTTYAYQASTQSVVAMSTTGHVFWKVAVGANPSAMVQAADGTLIIQAGGKLTAIR